MRLLDCQLRNVRLHGDLSLSFAAGITLIGGANETGKSSLVEALHRTLFLRASATGPPVEALQSRLHLGQPSVQLSFEARNDRWTLRKRFSGSSGQVSLQSAGDGRALSGNEAEERLAELLGLSETIGSRQANTVLPSRWAHLWVMQGSAGHDPLAGGKGHYDFDSLRSELERGGGAAVLQSDNDQRVLNQLEAAIAENLTSRGSRRHSPLWQAEQARQAAAAQLEQALARLQEYEQAGDSLASIGSQLQELQTTTLPALLERQRILSSSSEATTKLQAAIQLARQSLEPLRLRYRATERTLSDGKTLAKGIRERRQRLNQHQQAETDAAAQRQPIRDELERRQRQRQDLERQCRALQGHNQLVQALLEQTRSQADLVRLNRELAQQRQTESQRLALGQQLAALPAVGAAELHDLRTREQQLRDARTRQEAMAAGLRLVRADQPVRLNGEALEPGEQRLLSGLCSLEVGEGVALEISPGGGQTLESLAQRRLQAEAGLRQLLARLGVETSEQAERLAAERSRLEQQLAALGPAPTESAAALEAELHQRRQRSAELELLLSSQAEGRQQFERERAIPPDLAGLEALQRQLAQTLNHSSNALRQADGALDAARKAFQQHEVAEKERAAQLAVLQEELSQREQQLQELIDNHGGSEILTAQLAELAEQQRQQEAELQRLQAELAKFSGSDPVREQQELVGRIEAARRQVEQLIDQRGAARQRCDSISDDDPHAALEQARVQLENAETEHRGIARLCAARQLLQQLFHNAQADHSSRYSEPLARAIDSYLAPLLPGGAASQLHYDQASGFTGLRLRRGGEAYAFAELSGGMREQLAAALRLSMADVLKGAHDGCLPLLFDDAFTNCDPERVLLVKQMLTSAAERGLQVILLTCDPAAYGCFADQVVNLGDTGPSAPTGTTAMPSERRS
jgi:DNA repair exonuclease SbcCD ATPase subunit